MLKCIVTVSSSASTSERQTRLLRYVPPRGFGSSTVRIHHEPGEQPWAEVLELPGCFAAGSKMDELRQALTEAISLYLSEPGDVKHVELEDEPGTVTEHRMLARTA